MRKKTELHGESRSRIYKIWRGMLDRCTRPNHDSYPSYGGRGITICDEWARSYVAFSAWAKANGYRSDTSIDRIDPNGNYEPSNCRWATNKQQVRNRRKDVVGIVVQHNGESNNLSQWSRKLHINYTTLVKRYNNGLRGDDLFNQTRTYRCEIVSAILETRNGKAKLTSAQVDEIRVSQLSGADLARKFRVSQSAISMIRSGARR